MATFNDRLIRLERQMKTVQKDLIMGVSTHTVGGGGKFGLEDAIAAENRSFSFSGYEYELTADGAYFSLSANNPSSTDVYIEASNPTTNGSYAYLELHSNENTPNSTSWADWYVQDESGNAWSEIYMQTTDMYIASKNIYMETINAQATIDMLEDANPDLSYIEIYLASQYLNQNIISFGANKMDFYIEFDEGYATDKWAEATLDFSGIFLGVGTDQFINLYGVQDGTVDKSLGLDASGNIVTGSGGGGGATFLAGIGQSGEFPLASDTWKESPTFRIPCDGDSTYYFKMVIEFSGGSTDYQLSTKFTTSDVGILATAQMCMITPITPVMLVDQFDNYSVNHGTPVVWDTKVGYVNGPGMILTIEGTIQNTSLTAVDFIFNWKVFEGYASSYLYISAGSGFYQKTGAYYP